jgi:hypothetical protein
MPGMVSSHAHNSQLQHNIGVMVLLRLTSTPAVKQVIVLHLTHIAHAATRKHAPMGAVMENAHAQLILTVVTRAAQHAQAARAATQLLAPPAQAGRVTVPAIVVVVAAPPAQTLTAAKTTMFLER